MIDKALLLKGLSLGDGCSLLGRIGEHSFDLEDRLLSIPDSRSYDKVRPDHKMDIKLPIFTNRNFFPKTKDRHNRNR